MFTEEVGLVVRHVEPSATNNVPTVVSLSGLLGDVLGDHGYSRDDVVSVEVTGGFYGCRNLEGDHDWIVTGGVLARRTDPIVAGPDTDLLSYEAQSLQEALDQRLVAPLQPEGVKLVKDAINDYLDGGSPQLEFELNNDSISPDPTLVDPMAFVFTAWVRLQIVVEITTSVPDPF